MPKMTEMVKLLNKSGFLPSPLVDDPDLSTEDREENFISAIEDIPIENEEKLPLKILEFYKILFEKFENREDNQVKEIITEESMSEETAVTEQENLKFLLGTFEMWNKGKWAEVEVPEELTLADANKIFKNTLDEMPFEIKMEGAYNKEIDSYYMSLLRKPRKGEGKKVQREADRKAQEETDKVAIKFYVEQVESLYPGYIEGAASLPEERTIGIMETEFLSSVFEKLDEDQFAEIISDSDVAKAIYNLGNARKISSIVIKRKKIRKPAKSWDGEGEPFVKENLQKEPSLTYAVWVLAKENKHSLAEINKRINKKFGKKKNGEARNVKNTLRKMQKKVANFYIMETSTTGNITVAKI